MERARKIAFIGTLSTGKTTLLNACKEKYNHNPQIAFVDEVARSFFEKNPLPLSERLSFNVQCRIQDLVIQAEKEAELQKASIIFCDRAVIDAVVYSRSSGDLEGSKRLMDRVREQTDSYHKIFLLNPQDVPYVKDDIRIEDSTLRQRIHETFISLLTKEQIPHELLSGTIDQRMGITDKLMKHLLKLR